MCVNRIGKVYTIDDQQSYLNPNSGSFNTSQGLYDFAFTQIVANNGLAMTAVTTIGGMSVSMISNVFGDAENYSDGYVGMPATQYDRRDAEVVDQLSNGFAYVYDYAYRQLSQWFADLVATTDYRYDDLVDDTGRGNGMFRDSMNGELTSATLKVTSFSASVPEPTVWPLTLAGVLASLSLRRPHRRAA